MKRMKRDSDVFKLIEPLVIGMGYFVVELNVHFTKGGLRLFLVIHKQEGISTEDCSAVYKTVIARLNLENPGRDVSLEVCSPGISRNLKSVEEFSVFKGKKIRVLLYQGDEWSEGLISDISDDSFILDNVDEASSLTIGFNNIQKAKLF